jgi:hypothetical protein
MLSEELLPHRPSLFSEQLSTANLSVDACSGSSTASVALHVKPDKMPKLKRETFTA